MSTKILSKLVTNIDIPNGVTVSFKSNMLTVEGPLGKAHKNFRKIPVKIDINENKITLKAIGKRNKDYAILNLSLIHI